MKILIAEDDRVSRRILSSTLGKWDYQVVECEDGTQAWEELQKEGRPELIILDWVMPGMEGPEICQKLRESGQQAYVILLTSKDTKEEIVHGLEAGADDFVSKPFNRAELKARVEVGARIIGLQSDLAARVADLETLTRKLEEMSMLDALTGVGNRRQFEIVLDREWRRALRHQTPLAAVMMDIDNFKLYNDHYGHQQGDDCLKRVAQGLNTCLMRGGDFLGRYGGEEFVALFPETEKAGTIHMATQLREAVESLALEHPRSERTGAGIVTVSLGWACHTPQQGEEAHLLLKKADENLYEAKEKGGNQSWPAA